MNATPKEPPLSPLTGKPAEIAEVHSGPQFIRLWKKAYGIDTAPYFKDGQFYSCRCPDSQLIFFSPSSLVGEPTLYQELYSHDSISYSTEIKWEYTRALSILASQPDGSTLLEIGCGAGCFLEMAQGKQLKCTGLDWNPDAAERLKSKGIEFHLSGFPADALLGDRTFEAIVAFQVLEHVVDPLLFLEACVRHLKPGGTLILAVPDGHGPCGRIPIEHNLLDGPPHHMSRWNAAAFQYLCQIFPLKLCQLDHEPMNRIHLKSNLEHLLNPEHAAGPLFLQWKRKILKRLLYNYLLSSGSYSRWQGHSLIASYTCTAEKKD